MFDIIIIIKLMMLIFLLITLSAASLSGACDKTILFLPLDERYTTRVAFLNLAKVSPYCVVSPPADFLPVRKEPCDLTRLHNWVDENV